MIFSVDLVQFADSQRFSRKIVKLDSPPVGDVPSNSWPQPFGTLASEATENSLKVKAYSTHLRRSKGMMQSQR
ncbi:hypothetical protein RRG08_011318 [Elysia crispata]|uniref:Uncharacterized protein n=1 Tax=Elysia crispata TaxID=231223 RepID=A0AAE1CWF4_9GAST|nr:hypothetical protein RRG08_011318 [Elysia crispata]